MIFNFTTEVYFIDDDKSKLDSMKAVMVSNQIVGKYFSDPLLALNDLNRKNVPQEYNEITDLVNNFQIYIKNKLCSVVVCDYDMHQMNGLTLLNKIKDNNIRKILYTGIADEKIAIREFNEGNINAYFNKIEDIAELVKSVKREKNKYIENLQHIYLFKIKEKLYLDLLNSKKYKNFLAEIITDLNIGDVCLIDENNSYVMIDDKRGVYTLLIMPNSALNAELEVATEMNVDAKIIDEIKNNKKMLYMSKYYKANPDNIVECHKLHCENEIIRYALVKKDIFRIINH